MCVLSKGVVVIPESTRSAGPWLGATRANSLQRVANRPILCHVLDALSEAGVLETTIVAPADVAAEVSACVALEGPPGLAVDQLVHEDTIAGPTVAAVRDFVGDAPCVLHRGDGLLGETLFAPCGEDRPDAVVLVRDGALERRRLRLVSVERVVAAPTELPLGVAGASVLGPGVLAGLAEACPENQLLDFAAITERVAAAGGSTRVLVAQGWRHFAGDTLDLLDMNRVLLDRLQADSIPETIEEGNRFEGQVSIHPTAHVSSSAIVGPVLIGPHAWISDSYIGPHTSIAERVRIEGAELERSIVLADASVLHVGGRLVASIVGREARIFRDFSMPRALRLQVGDGDEVALC